MSDPVRDIKSEAEIRKLLGDRPEATRTYRVLPEVLGRIPLDEMRLRTMTDSEVHELADYLRVDADELRVPFRVVHASCGECSRRLTFLDFVHTAVEQGMHGVDQLRDILTGRAGAFITVRGRDGGRPVACFSCGAEARMTTYSEYSNSQYAYA